MPVRPEQSWAEATLSVTASWEPEREKTTCTDLTDLQGASGWTGPYDVFVSEGQISGLPLLSQDARVFLRASKCENQPYINVIWSLVRQGNIKIIINEIDK